MSISRLMQQPQRLLTVDPQLPKAPKAPGAPTHSTNAPMITPRQDASAEDVRSSRQRALHSGGLREQQINRSFERGDVNNPLKPSIKAGISSTGDVKLNAKSGGVDLGGGTQLTGPQIDAEANPSKLSHKMSGQLASMQNGETRTDLGSFESQESLTYKKHGVAGIQTTTGDDNMFDYSAKLGTANVEAGVDIRDDGFRMGAGYAANIAEIHGGVGEVTNKSQNDHRLEGRLSAGAPSGGLFVEMNDRDRDGATNYRVDVDFPIGTSPFGGGLSLETENPGQMAGAMAGAMAPIGTGPIVQQATEAAINDVAKKAVVTASAAKIAAPYVWSAFKSRFGF